ncbi:NAD-dependent epimerase/dehydratase family protein [Phenylobacterium sp.]
MAILVTGSAGLIGFHLARRLLARGNEVVSVDNLNATTTLPSRRRG